MLSRSQVVVHVIMVGIASSLLTSARAEFDSRSDGSDGELLVECGARVIDLGEAYTANPANGESWEMPSPNPGKGIYDPTQWAVVFKYTTIHISDQDGKVTFINHPKGAPVVWLATGEVTIDGEVNLDGGDGCSPLESLEHSVPGPGGFAGGLGTFGTMPASGGFGPGGGQPYHMQECPNSGGCYGTVPVYGCCSIYGCEEVIPLIGGSGGGGSGYAGRWSGGGAGGGAILIASSDRIVVEGGLSARGGNAYKGDGDGWRGGGGSGGGIRLVANEVHGDGSLVATGGTGSWAAGGDGRIRVEALEISLADPGSPYFTSSFAPGPVFPEPTPILRATALEGTDLPEDPDAGIMTVDAPMANGDLLTLDIHAENVEPGWEVTVYVIPLRGERLEFPAETPLYGTPSSSSTTALITLPPGPSEIQLKAHESEAP